MKKRTVLKVCRMIVAIAFLNFMLLALISAFIGGDALNGKIEDGRYYVGSHGHYTEVWKTPYHNPASRKSRGCFCRVFRVLVQSGKFPFAPGGIECVELRNVES